MKYWIVLLLMMAAQPAFPQMTLTEQLDTVFRKQTPGQPGIAVCIVENGKIGYRKETGVSDLTTQKPLDEFSNFRMASLSKQFTAMGILMLAEEHKLGLDDPIGKWLPELPARVGHQVLIRHLLTHSSGLIDYESLIPDTQTHQLLDADVMHLLGTQDTTYFSPGSAFRYSNSGFCLLALIIERVSHQAFADFIREKIFLPLGMEDSRIYVAGTAIPHRAMGFATDSTGQIMASDQSVTSATKGDGGVYTSLTDYAKWLTALDHGKPLDLGPVLRELRLPTGEVPGGYYAAGWFDLPGTASGKIPGSAGAARDTSGSRTAAAATDGEVLFHSGSTCGFATFVIRVPAKDWSLVYFSNLADHTEPFVEILRIVQTQGIADFTRIMQLHNLTR